MQQRYYDPVIGRFYSNDPVGFSADSPMMFNRYAYGNNNPYKFVDPNGEESVYIWYSGPVPGDKSFQGHASTITQDGTYISKFPTDGNKSPAKFHTIEDDIAIYGREPDLVFYVPLANESAANDYAKKLKSDDSQQWSVFNNCADAVASVLNSGGAKVPDGGLQRPSSLTHNLVNKGFVRVSGRIESKKIEEESKKIEEQRNKN